MANFIDKLVDFGMNILGWGLGIACGTLALSTLLAIIYSLCFRLA